MTAAAGRPRVARVAGQGTPATALLARQGISFSVHPYASDARHDSSRHANYGLEASAALGVPPERVFKTLVAEVDGSLTVGVVPAARRLDLKALAAAAGGRKAVLAEPAEAERATGYVVGGISPLGQRRRLPVVVDATAMDFATIYCSAGRRGLQIEIAPGDLVRAAQAVVAPIAQPPAS